MSKHEFLRQLREYLTGKLPASEVEDSVSYYDSYIDGQIRGGQREAEAVAALGDPRIIGRSIVDAAGRRNAQGYADTSGGRESRAEDRGRDARESMHENSRTGASGWRRWKLYGILALAVLVILVVLIAVTKVIAFFFPLIAVIVVLTVVLRHAGGSR